MKIKRSINKSLQVTKEHRSYKELTSLATFQTIMERMDFNAKPREENKRTASQPELLVCIPRFIKWRDNRIHKKKSRWKCWCTQSWWFHFGHDQSFQTKESSQTNYLQNKQKEYANNKSTNWEITTLPKNAWDHQQ